MTLENIPQWAQEWGTAGVVIALLLALIKWMAGLMIRWFGPPEARALARIESRLQKLDDKFDAEVLASEKKRKALYDQIHHIDTRLAFIEGRWSQKDHDGG